MFALWLAWKAWAWYSDQRHRAGSRLDRHQTCWGGRERAAIGCWPYRLHRQQVSAWERPNAWLHGLARLIRQSRVGACIQPLRGWLQATLQVATNGCWPSRCARWWAQSSCSRPSLRSSLRLPLPPGASSFVGESNGLGTGGSCCGFWGADDDGTRSTSATLALNSSSICSSAVALDESSFCLEQGWIVEVVGMITWWSLSGWRAMLSRRASGRSPPAGCLAADSRETCRLALGRSPLAGCLAVDSGEMSDRVAISLFWQI